MEKRNFFPADAVLVATGGISYKTTGSTGDGYRFAEELGHKVTELYPSLVPFNTKKRGRKSLQGLSLKNVDVKVMDGKKKLYDGFGEMMFTHFGVTGPLILSASSYTAKTARKKELSMFIDLKPALSKEQLDHRILRDFEEAKNRQFKNALGGLFPAKLTPVMIELSGINPEKKVNEVSREERLGFVELIKNLPLTVTGLRDYNEAIITKGGVSVKEVNPSTMESKLVQGLYFAGEVLDLDAVTGGFNLQIAWSTAYAAKTGDERSIDTMQEENMSFNIAIDGSAGAGKSTIAKRVSKELGFIYVDTGAMYRAIAVYMMQNQIDIHDDAAVQKACKEDFISIAYSDDGEQQVILNGENVTGLIRTEEVSKMASVTSANPAVRATLLDLQRDLAAKEDVLMDGRDIGTNILPHAQLKIYLTASVETRAKRRFLEQQGKGRYAHTGRDRRGNPGSRSA